MVTIAVQDQQAMAYLSGLQAKLKNIEPALAGIGMQLEPAVSGRFDSKTDPSGRPWAPWALATGGSNPDDGNGSILGRYGDMLFPPRPRVDPGHSETEGRIFVTRHTKPQAQRTR
jgi:hypothetical protein